MSRSIVLVALVSACQPTASVGSDGTRGGDTAASAETASSDAGATASGSSTSVGATASTAGSGDTGTPDAATICMELLVDDGDCTPAGTDTPCEVCLKLQCCADLMQCPSYEACYCTVTCTNGGFDAATCMQTCGETEASCDLTGCGVDECAQVCSV